jgi:hypothetical protein
MPLSERPASHQSQNVAAEIEATIPRTWLPHRKDVDRAANGATGGRRSAILASVDQILSTSVAQAARSASVDRDDPQCLCLLKPGLDEG